MNHAFERLTGRTKEQIIGHRAKEVFGIVEDHWLRAYEQVDRTGEPVTYENYGEELDKYYEIHAWKAGDKMVAMTFTDITERKRAERAVQEERDRLSSLINSISDEVWFADAYGRFTLTNPSAVREFVLGPNTGMVDVENMASSLEVLRPDGSQRPVEESPHLRALKGEVVKNEEEIDQDAGQERYAIPSGQRGTGQGRQR